jgi:hypothetical protein
MSKYQISFNLESAKEFSKQQQKKIMEFKDAMLKASQKELYLLDDIVMSNSFGTVEEVEDDPNQLTLDLDSPEVEVLENGTVQVTLETTEEPFGKGGIDQQIKDGKATMDVVEAKESAPALKKSSKKSKKVVAESVDG